MKHLQDLHLAADDGPVDGRVPLVVEAVSGRAALQQQGDDGPMAGDDGQMERGVPLLVLLIHQAKKPTGIDILTEFL